MRKFGCMRIESFEPFSSCVKGGCEGAFRCNCSINSKPQQHQHKTPVSQLQMDHRVTDQILGRQTCFIMMDMLISEYICYTFWPFFKKKKRMNKRLLLVMILLTVHKFYLYAFSCTLDWLHLTGAMFHFSFAFYFVSELTLFLVV